METEQDNEKDRSLFNTPLSPFGLYGIRGLPYTRLIHPRPYIYNSPLLNMVMNRGFPINFLEESETVTETNEIDTQVKVETCSVGTQYDLSDFGREKEIVEEEEEEEEEKVEDWFIVKDKDV
jgi:hypothetical protein